MSILSFENIDQWFFEYTEGNLSSDQVSQLMDFLQKNPELMDELKIWQHSKVTSKPVETFNSEVLIKSRFPQRTPLLLFSIVSLTILLGYLSTLYFPVSPRYYQTEIDTEIIDMGEYILNNQIKNKDLDVNISNVGSINTNENSSESATQKTFTQIKEPVLLTSNNSSPINSETNNISKTTSIETLSAIPVSFGVITNLKTTEHIKVNLNTQKNELNSQNRENKSKSIRAEGLNNVVAYLNTSKDFHTHKSLRTTAQMNAKKEGAKSSLNKLANNTLRKLDKITSQSIALRSTKQPYYHVPMMTGYRANPSMVGNAPGNRIQSTSRVQWKNQSNSQSLNSISWDSYVRAFHGGFGIDVNYSTYKHNAVNDYSIGAVYSPKFSVKNNITFEPSLRLKFGRIGIDQNSELIGSSIEMSRNNIIQFYGENQTPQGKQLFYKDIGLGFIINTKLLYFGMNADNLARHENNFYSLDLDKKYRAYNHYTAVIGSEYESLLRDYSISGYAFYQNYGVLNELWLGSNFRYAWMQIGVAVSNNFDYAASAGFNFRQHVTFNYNIDYSRSSLLNKRHLSHQVSLTILLKPYRQTSTFFKL